MIPTDLAWYGVAFVMFSFGIFILVAAFLLWYGRDRK